MWLGEIDAAQILDFKFTTRSTTGAPTTLAGTPAVSVYKNNDTTESTAGVSLTVDFDSRTGLNHVRIDTSADGTFYSIANDYQVVITAGTVGGTSVVSEVVAHFAIRNRSPLKPVTASRTLVVDASGLADANTVKVGPTAGGTAQTARDLGLALPAAAPNANGGLPILSSSGTTLGYTVSTVTTLTNLPAITANWLTAAGIAADAITAAKIATDAIGSAQLAASAITEIQAGLATSAALAIVAGYIDTEVAAIKAKTDQFVFTIAGQVDANALSGGGGLDAAGVRAAIGMATNDLDSQLDAILAAATSGGGGGGAITYTVTVTDAMANPLDGAQVWITTDEAGANVVAGSLPTDALGEVTFHLDAGGYYLWVIHSGYNRDNPTAITVS